MKKFRALIVILILLYLTGCKANGLNDGIGSNNHVSNQNSENYYDQDGDDALGGGNVPSGDNQGGSDQEGDSQNGNNQSGNSQSGNGQNSTEQDGDNQVQNNQSGNSQNGNGTSDNIQDENVSNDNCSNHADADSNDYCDLCQAYLRIYVDFYSINDLHGKIKDGDNHPGVDELTTFLKNAKKTDDYVVLISPGDMWQGSSESNLTKGFLTTDWMNDLDFAAMTLGNHEFDWGQEYIRANQNIAEFPFLAINVYRRSTNKLVDYCRPSTMVTAGNVKIGIIGAIGDCYSSISYDKVGDIYFKVGNELTELVKAESNKLRAEGADCIVYVLHDGYGQSQSNDSIPSSQIKSYYDVALSNGYVDLVFEGHTHQSYILKDQYGVYHIQHGGDNYKGISHIEIGINYVTDKIHVSLTQLIKKETYQNLADDAIVAELLNKYKDQVSLGDEVLGKNRTYRNDDFICQTVADLYYETGMKLWGDKYKIALGGGFLNVRSPYSLSAGNVTYAMLQSLLPFDNDLVLCSIKGRDLLNKFYNSNNSNYFISYGDYGESLRNQINPNEIYYIVVDSYTSLYAPNKLTEIERYNAGIYARDLLAEFVRSGGLE
jgi:2',3'-cyclic-nucleotide 2'-phosphodiesterase (5'-nucleotidase family)